jgi:hypothetical protein
MLCVVNRSYKTITRRKWEVDSSFIGLRGVSMTPATVILPWPCIGTPFAAHRECTKDWPKQHRRATGKYASQTAGVQDNSDWCSWRSTVVQRPSSTKSESTETWAKIDLVVVLVVVGFLSLIYVKLWPWQSSVVIEHFLLIPEDFHFWNGLLRSQTCMPIWSPWILLLLLLL